MCQHVKSRVGVLILVAILFAALPIPAVIAAPPLDVHIEVIANIDSTPAPFIASGPAVDDGLLCEYGIQSDLSIDVSPSTNGQFQILRIVKQFTCDDGSGSFNLNLVVRLDLTTFDTTARWNVIGGTGDYTNLHGAGELIGFPLVPGEQVLDLYDGRIH